MQKGVGVGGGGHTGAKIKEVVAQRGRSVGNDL